MKLPAASYGESQDEGLGFTVEVDYQQTAAAPSTGQGSPLS